MDGGASMIAALQKQGFWAWTAALYIFIMTPLVCVVIASFNYESVQSVPPSQWSLRWYAAALENSNFVRGAITSLVVATVATLIATPIGVLGAFGLWKSKSRYKAALDAFFALPIVVPGLVTGISLLVALSAANQTAGNFKLVCGHVLIVMPYVIRTTLASLSQFNPSLWEAAETLGANPAQVLWKIVLPIIRPGIVAGMIFGFILSFDDVNISLFLVDARTVTLPISILSYLQFNFDPSVAAISTILIGITFVSIILLERVFGLKRLFAEI
jgi:putative spermidine/putrescine transport system permease protein